MTKKPLLPKIKKKISSFVMEEEGKISKQSLFTLGAFIGSAAIAAVLASKKVDATSTITLGSSATDTQVTVTAAHTHHASHSSHGSHGSHGSHSNCPCTPNFLV